MVNNKKVIKWNNISGMKDEYGEKSVLCMCPADCFTSVILTVRILLNFQVSGTA